MSHHHGGGGYVVLALLRIMAGMEEVGIMRIMGMVTRATDHLLPISLAQATTTTTTVRVTMATTSTTTTARVGPALAAVLVAVHAVRHVYAAYSAWIYAVSVAENDDRMDKHQSMRF